MNKRKSGFTTAELLITVAIIAVLVAIAIPVFTGHLEKSREATDLANVRSGYAMVIESMISDSADLKQEDGSFRVVVNLKQKQEGWSTPSDHLTIGDVSITDPEHWIGTPVPDGTCEVTITPGDSSVTLIWSGESGGESGGGTTNTETGNRIGNAIRDLVDMGRVYFFVHILYPSLALRSRSIRSSWGDGPAE